MRGQGWTIAPFGHGAAHDIAERLPEIACRSQPGVDEVPDGEPGADAGRPRPPLCQEIGSPQPRILNRPFDDTVGDRVGAVADGATSDTDRIWARDSPARVLGDCHSVRRTAETSRLTFGGAERCSCVVKGRARMDKTEMGHSC